MLSRLAKICVLSLWQDSLKLNVGLIIMFFLYSQSASDTMLNRKKIIKKPWPGGAVGWSIILYTKS